ncbi:MAG: hypothetical protein IT535_03015 [Bauldia sp.]|nr:hypothetical protein [Bauldia sp.]
MQDALVVLGYVIAPLLIGILIGYGIFQWQHRRRSAALDAASEAATREMYREPDR